MSQLNPVTNSAQPDQQYFDLTVSNFDGENSKPVKFEYNEPRANAFLNKPEDYWLSILRFTADTNTLPVVIPSIKQNSPNRDDTIYSVTLEWSSVPNTAPDVISQQYIQWIPQDKSADVPLPPSQNFNKLQNNQTGYYNCYNYSFFVLQIYRALEVAFADIEAQATSKGAVLPSPNNPVVNWDTTNNQLILYADTAGYNLDPAGWVIPYNPIKIYFNSALYALFSSLPATLQGFEKPTLGRNALIGVVNIGDTNLQSIIPKGTTVPYKAICVYQEYSTTASMSPIVAVVFTTTTLPVHPSQVSTPVVYYNGKPSIVGSNANTSNIITDIASDNGVYKPNLVYQPSSQYRLVTLYGNQPLTNLDFQIYYRLKDGSLAPLLLEAGGAVTLKIAFLKKSSYIGKGIENRPH